MNRHFQKKKMMFLRGRGKKILVIFACFFLIVSGFSVADAAQPSNSNSHTVKAGVFNFDGYHMVDEDGKYTGFGIEFLNLVSEYSHLNFEFVGYDNSWNDMLAMLENGEIDMVTSARMTASRREKFAFSRPIGRNKTLLSIQADNEKYQTGNYETYDGILVGVLVGSSQNQSLVKFAQEKGFSYETKEYSDSDKLAADLQAGKIDAILSSNLRKTENERTLDTIETDNFYAIVRKEDTELLDEINYAIGQMDINEGDWSNVLFYQYYGPVYSSALSFTERELTYIAEVASGKKTITITANGDRKPYSYVEDGELKGILPDYFAEVMKTAGLPYEIVISEDREKYYDLVNTNGVDVIIDRRGSDASVNDNHSVRGFTTDAYMTTGVAKVTRKDASGKISTVAVANSQGTFPIEGGIVGNAEMINYATREDALQAVLKGKADAAYVYTYTAQLFVNNDPTESLHYSIVNGLQFPFQMYVRESCDHELVTILNKCIYQVSGDILTQLITQYTSNDQENLTFIWYLKAHPGIMLGIVFVFFSCVALIFTFYLRSRWNQKILQTTERAKKELEEQLAIVNALSRDYLNVYAVNREKSTARIIKMKGYVITGLTPDAKEEFPYEMLIDNYIKERVYVEDHSYLREALDLDKIAEKLKNGGEYIGSYRVQINGELHNFQFIYVKVEETNSQKDGFILAGFRNIDEIVRKEQEQREILSVALAEAQHANRAKTTFLNSMSHDIRTPMNAIIGFTSLASSHIDSKELVQNYLGKIMTSSRHLLSLINDVLDMSRIESGKVKIEEQEASLPEILHDLKTIVQSDVKAKQLEFYIDTLDVTNETIICDKLRLNQVLLNILSNAMKYTKPGGKVSVRIIQLADAPEGYASYEFRIKDTGIGMSKPFLKHLFEPFEREQTATISGIQGTGLGLAITKNIVDMMNGTIAVESEAGKGSEFIVTFSFRVVDNSEKVQYLDKLTNLRALIVDDDINTCMSVSKMLSSIGMRPDWTTLGKEAIFRAEFAQEQKEPFSIYIIDWLMPDMNGIEIVRRIRKAVGREAMIILLTAYDWADVEEEAKEAGITAFCSKPVFLSELCQILTAPYTVQESVEEADSSEECLKGHKILLVEDNELNQEIAQTILEEAGFILDTADDGTVAVEMMENAPRDTYELILMDIQMPIMDGYEATRTIRAMKDPVKAAIPIVAMTANAFEEDRQKAIEAGMNGHVAKPIDIEKLMETLESILLGSDSNDDVFTTN